MLFFLLIDGYSIDVEWFRPGKAGPRLLLNTGESSHLQDLCVSKDQVVTLIFLGYIVAALASGSYVPVHRCLHGSEALIYFVLLNIFVAIVLDTFSLASRLYAVEANKKNPMIAACML